MKMKITTPFYAAVLFMMAIGIIALITPNHGSVAVAQQTGDQNMLNLSFIGKGVSGQGTRILQTGDLSNLSPAVATATLTSVVAAPASGSTYIRSVAVEKSTGAAGTFTLQYGTGTNCGTGTTVLIGPVTNPPIQTYYLGAIVPAGKDLCAQTDAATTSIRLLYN